MKKTAFLVGLIATALTGCGGGDGGNSPSAQTSSGNFQGNGIYVNNTDFSVMLIDSKRAKNNLIVGDFANKSVYFVDSATTTTNTMNTTGFTYIDSGTFDKDANQKMTATIKNNAVTLTAMIKGRPNLVYSMNKTIDSLPLSQLVGVHEDKSDGTSLEIYSDGSFISNGDCTLTGKLVSNGAYFNITNANATQCSDSSINGSYDGVALTVEHNGKIYIAGLFSNDSYITWGSYPKN